MVTDMTTITSLAGELFAPHSQGGPKWKDDHRESVKKVGIGYSG
jgi:hypothetical protein